MSMMHAYCDESGCFSEEYQSIGIVSGRPDAIARARDGLSKILRDEKIIEIKFEKVRTNRAHLRAADRFVKSAIDLIGTKDINIDVICWYMKDARHAIIGRDDVANLARMYYKILRSLSEKWRALDWIVFPDKGNEFPWNDVKHYLNNTRIIRKPKLFTLFEQEKYLMRFHGVFPQDSVEEPLIQLSDLFAGMVCFSIGNIAAFKSWHGQYERAGQRMLLEDPRTDKLTERMENRFKLIHNVYLWARPYGLQVSLLKEGHLKTFRKCSPLRIWYYQAVNPGDKAPTRKSDR